MFVRHCFIQSSSCSPHITIWHLPLIIEKGTDPHYKVRIFKKQKSNNCKANNHLYLFTTKKKKKKKKGNLNVCIDLPRLLVLTFDWIRLLFSKKKWSSLCPMPVNTGYVAMRTHIQDWIRVRILTVITGQKPNQKKKTTFLKFVSLFQEKYFFFSL